MNPFLHYQPFRSVLNAQWSRACSSVVCVLCCSISFSVWADANKDIEQLIDKVAAMPDAKFIRNGTEHSAIDAAKFLREKRDWKCKNSKSVDEFIDNCATSSTTTGEIYKIKLAGNKVMPACDVLKEMAKP